MMIISTLASLFLTVVFLYHVEQQLGSKIPDFKDELRDISWGQINFLHTTDTHSWYLGHLNQKQYSADWGDFVSYVTHLRDLADVLGQDLLVVDTGDKHDGNGLGDVTPLNGIYSSKIFAELEYDLLTIGNHELYVEEITEHEFKEIVPLFGNRYVCSNVEYITDEGEHVPFGNRYRVFTTKNQNLKVLSFGILFDFARKNRKAVVTPIMELIKVEWFKEVLLSHQSDSELDMIVIIGHIPVSHEWLEFQLLHKFIRSYFPDLPIQYFGGHSHIRDFVKLDDRSFGLQSGRYCETVGWLSIDDLSASKLEVDRKYIDFNVHSFMHHSNHTTDDFNTIKGLKVTNELSSMASELQLNHIYGKVPQNFLINAAPIDDENNLLNFIRNKVLVRLIPKLNNAKLDLELSNSRIIIINTGSIRYDLYKGPFTKNSKYIVSPFKNKWKFISRVPKNVALGIEGVLNKLPYVMSELELVKKGEAQPMLLNLLRPETKYTLDAQKKSEIYPSDNYFEYHRKSYGYVTHDDFGEDGDDTLHKSFPSYTEPNVIQSYEGDGEFIDVIFYDFIEPQILFALHELGFESEGTKLYNDLSNEYNVGQLLQDYISENWNI